jgi:hypothetical protein
MFDRIRHMFSKPAPARSDEARDFITRLATSDIWILAIGVRGTPVMPNITDAASVPAALKTLTDYRKELSELGDDDSVFPFNFKRDTRQILPFFSSEECAHQFLADSGFMSDLSVFQPYCLLAGFVAAPENDKFDLVLDLRCSSERKIEDDERLILRTLSTAQ